MALCPGHATSIILLKLWCHLGFPLAQINPTAVFSNRGHTEGIVPLVASIRCLMRSLEPWGQFLCQIMNPPGSECVFSKQLIVLAHSQSFFFWAGDHQDLLVSHIREQNLTSSVCLLSQTCIFWLLWSFHHPCASFNTPCLPFCLAQVLDVILQASAFIHKTSTEHFLWCLCLIQAYLGHGKVSLWCWVLLMWWNDNLRELCLLWHQLCSELFKKLDFFSFHAVMGHRFNTSKYFWWWEQTSFYSIHTLQFLLNPAWSCFLFLSAGSHSAAPGAHVLCVSVSLSAFLALLIYYCDFGQTTPAFSI